MKWIEKVLCVYTCYLLRLDFPTFASPWKFDYVSLLETIHGEEIKVFRSAKLQMSSKDIKEFSQHQQSHSLSSEDQ